MSLFEFVVNKLNLEISFKISCINVYKQMESIKTEKKLNIIEQTYQNIINEKDNFYKNNKLINHQQAFDFLRSSLKILLHCDQILNRLYIRMSQNDNTYRKENNLYRLDFKFNNKDYINVPDLETMLKRLFDEKTSNEKNNIDYILNNIILTNDIQNNNINESTQKLMLFNLFECYFSISFCTNILYYFILKYNEDRRVSYMNTMRNLYFLILPENISVDNFEMRKNSIIKFIGDFMSNTDSNLNSSNLTSTGDNDKQEVKNLLDYFTTTVASAADDDDDENDDENVDDANADKNANNLSTQTVMSDTSSNPILPMIGDASKNPVPTNKSSNNQPSDFEIVNENMNVGDTNGIPSPPSSKFLSEIFPDSNMSKNSNSATFRPYVLSTVMPGNNQSTITASSSAANLVISQDLQTNTRVEHCLPILYENIKQSKVNLQINNNDALCKLIDDIFTPNTMP